MGDAVDRGYTVTGLASLARPIEVTRETTAAFVGRSLRGPVNEPVLVTSLAEFRRRFGEVRASFGLGPALEQFFEQGGRRAWVVRLVNKARGALICLPADGGALVLRAVEPGATERIRAAVDYDGIDAGTIDAFNLTLQRIDPATGFVRDQEIHRRLSIDADSESFVVDRLLASSIARVERPLPSRRPEATSNPAMFTLPPYVGHAQDGADGSALTDYDLVGSRSARSGLFALEGAGRFDLLYLAPDRDRIPGPAPVLAADRYCRSRAAMLVVDPPESWRDAAAAIAGIRDLGYSSPNMLAYFPRLKLRGSGEAPGICSGGALAGALAKLDRACGPWHRMEETGIACNRRWMPAAGVDAAGARALARAGINAVVTGSNGSARFSGAVTLARRSESTREFGELPLRRFLLQLIAAIEDGTRWAVFDAARAGLGDVVRTQVTDCLEALVEAGGLERIGHVGCDLRMAQGSPETRREGGNELTIYLAFEPVGSPRPLALTLHHTVSGCRVAATAFRPAPLD